MIVSGKKIYLLLLAGLTLVFCAAYLTSPGRSCLAVEPGSTPAVKKDTPPMSPERRAAIESLPYLSGYKPAPKRDGVTFHDETRAWLGLNLYVSASNPRAILTDMRGDTLCSWGIDLVDSTTGGTCPTHCRRAHLFPTGELIGIFEVDGDQSGPLVKLDLDSRVLWSYRARCHHDLFVRKDGTIYVLTYRLLDKHPRLPLTGSIMEDFITVLTPGGKEVKSVSILDCFLNSDYADVLHYLAREGDVFHTNTVEVLDGSLEGMIPIFKKGRVLISLRHLSTVALIDMEKEKVVWMLWGMWRVQHQPTVLPGGNILLFDNSDISRRSRILEFNPLTQEIVWRYDGDTEHPFFSERMGSNQRLPNGNTLITDSENGRAFEVTKGGEIVWEFYNPHRSGDDKNLIATLYELIRLDPESLSFRLTKTGY